MELKKGSLGPTQTRPKITGAKRKTVSAAMATVAFAWPQVFTKTLQRPNFTKSWDVLDMNMDTFS